MKKIIVVVFFGALIYLGRVEYGFSQAPFYQGKTITVVQIVGAGGAHRCKLPAAPRIVTIPHRHDLHVRDGLALLVDHAAGDHGVGREPELQIGERLSTGERDLRARLHRAAGAVLSTDETGALGHEPISAWLEILHCEFAARVGGGSERRAGSLCIGAHQCQVDLSDRLAGCGVEDLAFDCAAIFRLALGGGLSVTEERGEKQNEQRFHRTHSFRRAATAIKVFAASPARNIHSA